MWDTIEPMPRSQDPFGHRVSSLAGWQQAGPPVPAEYPSGGLYPQDSPYPGEGTDEPAGQYPSTGDFEPFEPSQPWPDAPASAMPVAEAPAPPAGHDQYSQGDAYPGPYGNGQGQFLSGQSPPGTRYRLVGQGLPGRLAFSPSPVAIAVAVTVAVGILLVVLGAHALS